SWRALHRGGGVVAVVTCGGPPPAPAPDPCGAGQGVGLCCCSTLRARRPRRPPQDQMGARSRSEGTALKQIGRGKNTERAEPPPPCQATFYTVSGHLSTVAAHAGDIVVALIG